MRSLYRYEYLSVEHRLFGVISSTHKGPQMKKTRLIMFTHRAQVAAEESRSPPPVLCGWMVILCTSFKNFTGAKSAMLHQGKKECRQELIRRPRAIIPIPLEFASLYRRRQLGLRVHCLGILVAVAAAINVARSLRAKFKVRGSRLTTVKRSFPVICGQRVPHGPSS